jgi:hypothetical protein
MNIIAIRRGEPFDDAFVCLTILQPVKDFWYMLIVREGTKDLLCQVVLRLEFLDLLHQLFLRMLDMDFVDTWGCFYTSGTSPAGFLAITLEEALKGPLGQYIATSIVLKICFA